MTATLPIAQIVPATEAEGPGLRFAVWLQGCPLRCPGCCNPEMLPFHGGEMVAVDELVARVETAVREHDVEGVTLLGGEPFAHAVGAAPFARRVRELGLTVMIFSGYEIEALRASDDPAVLALLERTDILVDGPYDRDRPETRRRWIGSANQRVHHLSGRTSPDDPRWFRPNTLEIRLVDGEVVINGFPAVAAVGLWKRFGAAQRLG
jgi:anaerobic ribonucleoside-triphosphate reductase activating protein